MTGREYLAIMETHEQGPRTAPQKVGRIVELSHVVVPGEEEFTLELKTFNVEEVMPRIKRRSDTWYVLQEVRMSTHVGTHIEFPYHHRRDGKSAADYPIERLVGDAVVLDYSHKKKGEEITAEEICGAGVDIRCGDIVLIRTDMHKLWKTPRAHDRPALSVEAAQHLVERGIYGIGTDATGLEVRGRDDQPVHKIFFAHDVAMIESMTNLDKLSKERFTIYILPLRVQGMDSCPVRIIACEREVVDGTARE
jgi:arylformamidase